jgi:hypothetical protein
LATSVRCSAAAVPAAGEYRETSLCLTLEDQPFWPSGNLRGKSDDSTFLGGSDANFGNSLLLPNHDLDAGYAKMDVSGSYALNRTIRWVSRSKTSSTSTTSPHSGPRAADQRADRRDRQWEDAETRSNAEIAEIAEKTIIGFLCDLCDLWVDRRDLEERNTCAVT